MKLSLAAIALVGFSTVAAAAGMSGSDMVGKRVLDANGAPIGQVVGVTDNDRETVIATPDGHRIKMDSSRITESDSPNTLITIGDSQADALNRLDRKAPIVGGE